MIEVSEFLQLCYERAKKYNSEHVHPEHLLFEVSVIEEFNKTFLKYGIKSIKKLQDFLEQHFKKTEITYISDPVFNYDVEIIIKSGLAFAFLANRKKANLHDVFVQILRNAKCSAILTKFGFDFNKFFTEQDINANLVVIEKTSKKPITQTEAIPQDKNIKIIQYTENYNELAKKGKFAKLIGRSTEIEQIVHVLSRKTKNSIILCGNSGIGKTAIVEGLAQKIVSNDKSIPKSLKNLQIFSLDVNDLLAGAKHHGSFEERIKNIISELEKTENCLLFIDEIYTIMGAGGMGANDLSSVLKVAISRGKIKIIGCITDEDFRRHLDKDNSLLRRFVKLDIAQPTKKQVLEILQGLTSDFEKHYSLKIQTGVLESIVDLTEQFLHNKYFPEKAIDLLDSALSRKKINQKDEKELTVLDIKNELAKIVGISSITLDTTSKTNILELNTRINTKIFGQEQAIKTVCDLVSVAKSGLRTKTKPLFSVLFHGMSSVGKTEVAKELAKNLGIELVRFDLSAYQEKFTLSTLIGAPPGYLGYSDGKAGDGLLINALEKTPNCVLLLDEIEKAHPEILNILLQIMDYGILTSSSGKQVSCRNAYIIMTSNIGSDVTEKSRIGFGDIDNSDKFDEVYKNFFKPEFRARLDAVIKFNKLTQENMKNIVLKALEQIRELCIEQELNISLIFTDNLLKYITNKAFNHHLGARIVNTILDTEIKPILANEILLDQLKKEFTIDYDKQVIIKS